MTIPGHARAILLLGLPLIGGHLAQFAIGLTDTVMLGWYGIAELAAVTLGASYFFVFFILGSGFALAVMPIAAAAAAEGDEQRIRRSTRMGMWLSMIYAMAAMPAMLWSEQILRMLGQDPEVAALAGQYLRIAGWGLFPALLVMVLKNYLAGLERTQAVFWITVTAAATNALANYMLIFGHWGAPELGIVGAACASIASQAVSLIAVVIYQRRALPHYNLFQRLWRVDPEILWQVFRMGVPIGLTTVAEVSLFSASAVLMGWLGKVPLAAHGIVITISSGTFMVQLGLSNVATIRAGNAYGRRDPFHMARGGKVVIALSQAFAVLTLAAFLIFPEPLMSLFMETDNPVRDQILVIGVPLLVVSALFQFVDGAQAIGLGLLRGVQDTRVPMMIAVLSYWGIGLPTSYMLGFVFGLEGIGVWLGLCAGLACAAAMLMWRFWRRALGQVEGRVAAQQP
ncbi:MATE family efflux transporter [Pukyongiella litopenaei]|uniref:Multidrug-efflux transporter n=2 Tax=Pukyongiella litopenaei TaxID=2605946 RepID=A0A2S0MKX8_9RHOB|nr:MATE family efflux transporter [Pukyongiella litopenaei]